MTIEPEMMRSCVLEAFRKKPQTQYETLKYDVAQVAVDRGVHDLPGTTGHGPRLPREDWRRMREAIWGLIAEGVCVPGMNDSNEGWPFVSLTEYGEQVASSPAPVPHDSSGYIAALEAQQPLDPTESAYLVQALEAHNRGLADAAAVMLGAASEHLLEQLVDAIGKADPAESAVAQSALAGPALAAQRYALAYFTAHEAALSRPIRETLNTSFGSIAALIRVSRNDAGHPALPGVSRDESLVNLQLFPRLRLWVLTAMGELPL